MIYLGLSLGFNSSASLWEDDKCLASVSQERITGKRNTKELPFLAAKECFKIAGIELNEYCVAYSHYEELSNDYLLKNYSKQYCTTCNEKDSEDLFKELIEEEVGGRVCGIKRVEHHTAHEYSAYAVYGFEKHQTVLTMDGFGDGISARLKINDSIVAELPLVKSPALYYQFVTGALGFKEHQHEGKITGLATGNYTDNTELVNDYFHYFFNLWNDNEPLCELSDEELELVSSSHIIDFDKFLRLKKTVYKYVKDNLPNDYCVNEILLYDQAVCFAVAVQKFVENIINNFLVENRTELTDSIYLAGGMFANVAVNRMFGNDYKNVYISPAMGDEGTAMGAACFVSAIRENLTFHPEYIIAGGLECESFNIPNEQIAICLKESKDQIVHLVTGRSEFGPRALMHRSSLFPATLSRHSEKLNRAMHRSEFMPYAPVCQSEDCDELFYNWKPFEKSLHFMTVALKTKEGVLEKYPAGVHKDGTCRVQVVHRDFKCEAQAWNILEEYKQKTNGEEIILINTSFNMHNEPTCCTTEQCNSAWERSGGIGRLYFKQEEV